jgi:RNA polymerase sigma factor (sigma-70 family)
MSVTLPPFQTLLDEHARDLHRFLVASVGPHDGADCFQETVVAALRAYPDLRHADNLRGWLFTIAHRKVVDHARQRGRRALPVADPAEVAQAGGGPGSRGRDRGRAPATVEPTAVDGAPAPDPDLLAAVRALPPKQRTAVVHRYLLDRPYPEVAAVVGCSEDAARQNVRVGLQRLRTALSMEVMS